MQQRVRLAQRWDFVNRDGNANERQHSTFAEVVHVNLDPNFNRIFFFSITRPWIDVEALYSQYLSY